MEEPNAPQPAPQVANPPTTDQSLPSQRQPSPAPAPASAPAPAPSSASPPTSRKRPLESDAFLQNSNYFKIRAVVRDLRPHFIEVLRTPDYQNCKASHEIQEQLKTLMKLYSDLRADVESAGKSKNVQDGRPSSGENLDHKTSHQQQPPHVKSEIKLTTPVTGLSEDFQGQGTYVVGGSAFGWNFITFSGKEPVYYGVTKEQFRSQNSIK